MCTELEIKGHSNLIKADNDIASHCTQKIFGKIIFEGKI